MCTWASWRRVVMARDLLRSSGSGGERDTREVSFDPVDRAADGLDDLDLPLGGEARYRDRATDGIIRRPYGVEGETEAPGARGVLLVVEGVTACACRLELPHERVSIRDRVL